MSSKKEKILIVDDDRVLRTLLNGILLNQGYECICVDNGTDGIKEATKENGPKVVIMDWMLPDIDGIEATKIIKERQEREHNHSYIIVLTSRNKVEDLVTALSSGADDFVSKPFDTPELLARIKVGLKFFVIKNKLTEHIKQLQEKNKEIDQLQDLLPICCKCQKIKNQTGYWEKFENYLKEHGIVFSHGYCEECYAEELEKLGIKKDERDIIDLSFKIRTLHNDLNNIDKNVNEMNNSLIDINDIGKEMKALVKNKFTERCKNCKENSDCNNCEEL